MEIGLFYGSNGGNTKIVAEKVKNILNADIFDIADINKASFEKYNFIIFATSTWGTGELSDDWEMNLKMLDDLNLDNKFVAFVGLGDQYTYGSTFCDALNLIYQEIKDKNINLIGQWPVDGYEHDESESILNDKFLGLIIDEDNEPDLTDERIKKWTEQVTKEFS